MAGTSQSISVTWTRAARRRPLSQPSTARSRAGPVRFWRRVPFHRSSRAAGTRSPSPACRSRGSALLVALLGKGGLVYFRDRAPAAVRAQPLRGRSADEAPSTWTTGARWQTRTSLHRRRHQRAANNVSPSPPTTTTTTSTTPTVTFGAPANLQRRAGGDGGTPRRRDTLNHERELDWQPDVIRLPVAGPRQPRAGGPEHRGRDLEVPYRLTAADSTPSYAWSSLPATPKDRRRLHRTSFGPVAAQPAPTATTAPQVSGTTTQGQTLSNDVPASGPTTQPRTPTSGRTATPRARPAATSTAPRRAAAHSLPTTSATRSGLVVTASNAAAPTPPPRRPPRPSRPRLGRADQHRGAADQRNYHAGPDPRAPPRHLDRQPDLIRLPVARSCNTSGASCRTSPAPRPAATRSPLPTTSATRSGPW